VLDDGRKLTADLVREWARQELARIVALVGPAAAGTYEHAAEVFVDMSCREDFVEFLTLPLYELMD